MRAKTRLRRQVAALRILLKDAEIAAMFPEGRDCWFCHKSIDPNTSNPMAAPVFKVTKYVNGHDVLVESILPGHKGCHMDFEYDMAEDRAIDLEEESRNDN